MSFWFSARTQMPEPDRQALVRPVRARLHGTDRNVEFDGDLTLSQLPQVLQADDLALVGRQGVDRLAPLPHLEHLIRGWREGYEGAVGRRHRLDRHRGAPRL